jgi:hypothetical protein
MAGDGRGPWTSSAAPAELPLMVTARVRLDWSDPSHWAAKTLPCRRCRTATHGRDSKGSAVHQSCLEDELAQEMAGGMTGGRFVDERYPRGGTA